MIDLALVLVLNLGPVTCTPGEPAPPNSWCDTPDPDPATVQHQLPEETEGRQQDCADGTVGRVQDGVLVCGAPATPGLGAEPEPEPAAAPAPAVAPAPPVAPAPAPRPAAVVPAPVPTPVAVPAPVVVEPVVAAVEVPPVVTAADVARAVVAAVLGRLAAFLGAAR